MSRSRQLLCTFYGVIAALAFFGTARQNSHYFGDPSNVLGAFGTFVVDTKATPASRSIAVDIAIVFLAAAAFMLFEARKLGMRFAWVYIVLGLLVAISVTFPLFLLARERKLASTDDERALAGGQPTVADLVGLVAVTALTFGLSWFVST